MCGGKKNTEVKRKKKSEKTGLQFFLYILYDFFSPIQEFKFFLLHTMVNSGQTQSKTATCDMKAKDLATLLFFPQHC